MRALTPILFVAILIGITTGAGAVMAQDAPEATRLEVESKPTRVTAYRGRAWVERTITQPLQPGIHRLIFTELPRRWHPNSVQARVQGNATVLGIDTQTRQVATPAGSLAQWVQEIKDAKRAVQDARDDRAVTAASIDLLQAMMTAAATTKREEVGTAKFDLDAAKSQLDFFSKRMRAALDLQATQTTTLETRSRALEILEGKLKDAGSATRTTREAVVELAVPRGGSIGVTLGYLVSNATWSPRYDVRGDLDDAQVSVEYGAEVSQQSGEDWTDITLVLSTAQPSQSANPPHLGPVYVDVKQPPPPSAPSAMRSRSGYATDASKESVISLGVEMEMMAEASAMDARVSGGGSSVTFTLPRRITVATDAKSAQRTRIAEFSAAVEFTFVAMPVLTEQVYLRGRFKNDSEYQLLPGRAGIFMNGDYVGPTSLASVAPAAKMELYFGADPALSATRTMLTKNTGETGVFGGWVRTGYEFVLGIDNGSDRAVSVELWDRRPVSRSEEIEVKVIDLSLPLSTDADYLRDQAPLGLMRWDVRVGPHRTGKRAESIRYQLSVERKEGVQMTPLPD